MIWEVHPLARHADNVQGFKKCSISHSLRAACPPRWQPPSFVSSVLLSAFKDLMFLLDSSCVNDSHRDRILQISVVLRVIWLSQADILCFLRAVLSLSRFRAKSRVSKWMQLLADVN